MSFETEIITICDNCGRKDIFPIKQTTRENEEKLHFCREECRKEYNDKKLEEGKTNIKSIHYDW